MSIENHKEFIKKAKEEYRKIGCIECPAFCGEKIYFNQKGFKHLLMKNGKYRTREQQIRRCKLIPNILSVISSSEKVYSYRKSDNVEFWSLSRILRNNYLVIVVIKRSSNDNRKYFLSVMDKVLTRNAKAPKGASNSVCHQQSPD